MFSKRAALVCFVYILYILALSTCEDVHGCQLLQNSDAKKIKLLEGISPILNQTFQTTDKTSTYYLSICSNVTSQDRNASVVRQDSNHKLAGVFGRRNATDIAGGSGWIMLSYYDGDGNITGTNCSSPYQTHVLTLCSAEHSTAELKLIENNYMQNHHCFLLFELKTCLICPEPKHLSTGSVICILFFTAIIVYIGGGVCYRRIIKGAKGFEQIPHHQFWRNLGNLQADGCNFVCRTERDPREEAWQQLTNNFNDPHEDRDDAMLRP